jgi:GNAT superfamily N-acetyltransferase
VQRLSIRTATSAADFEQLGSLVREYVESLPFVLDFQDIEHELAHLDTEYGPPDGCAWLAEIESVPVGCVALRPLEPPLVAELKRMYVRPAGRHQGAGRALAVAALDRARDLGYERVRLDTVAELVEAARLYEALGFFEIEAYRHNPLPTARFYEVRLRGAGSG